MELHDVLTSDLSAELQRRSEVLTLYVLPYEQFKVTIKDQEYALTGPAVVIINQD